MGPERRRGHQLAAGVVLEWFAGGTLEPDQPDSMGNVRPDDADAGTRRFVLTARRTDSADCAATLEWWLPGFNTPGIGSWTEF